MNWLDFIILAGLIAGVTLGYRRGFIRQAMGLIGLILGVIIAINYVDWLTAKFLQHMNIPAYIVSFFSFILLFAAVFMGFKILGFMFYRIGSLTPLKRLDPVGGGLFGFLQAWILTGFVLLLLMFFPLPRGFLDATDSSFFAPIMRGSIPLLYEESSIVHPQSRSFLDQISKAFRFDDSPLKQKQTYRFGKQTKKSVSKSEEIFAEIKKRFSRQDS
jgi:membrane protein required for colicin V production